MIKHFRKFFGKFRFNSLVCLNFLKYFGIQLVVFSIIIVIVYFSLLLSARKGMMALNQHQAARAADLSAFILFEVKNVESNLYIDQNVHTLMSSTDALIYQEYLDKTIQKMIYYKNILRHIDSIYLYSAKKEMYYTTDGETAAADFADAQYLETYFQELSQDEAVIPRQIAGRYPKVISFIRAFKDLGYIIINVNYESYKKAIDNTLEDASQFYIIGQSNQVVFEETGEEQAALISGIAASQKTKIYKEGGRRFIGTAGNLGGNLQFIVLTGWKDYNKQILSITALVLGILALFVLISIGIAFMISFSAFGYLINLYDVVDNNASPVDLSKLRENEEKYIATKIIALIDDNKTLRDQLDQRLFDYNRSQLQALQRQINPHFLNNVLTAVSTEILCDSGPDSAALNMIVKLTRIIKYSFTYEPMLVALTEEIQFLQDYIDLLRERFGDFSAEFSISSEAKSQKILRLSLQPLIENALYHGIYDLKQAGKIKISAYLSEGQLYFEIWDNGVGMETEDLEYLRRSLAEETAPDAHIGMKNVYKRLRLIYGSGAKLQIDSVKNKYTRVVIVIPAQG